MTATGLRRVAGSSAEGAARTVKAEVGRVPATEKALGLGVGGGSASSGDESCPPTLTSTAASLPLSLVSASSPPSAPSSSSVMVSPWVLI